MTIYTLALKVEDEKVRDQIIQLEILAKAIRNTTEDYSKEYRGLSDVEVLVKLANKEYNRIAGDL